MEKRLFVFAFVVFVFLVAGVNAEIIEECEPVTSWTNNSCAEGLVQGMGIFGDASAGTCVKPDGSSDCHVVGSSSCGDGSCAGNETVESCPADCSSGFGQQGGCGDGICQATESAEGCPEDCDPDSMLFGDGANCSEDVFTCSDGTVLQRDPALGCEFPECPFNPELPECMDFCGDGSCQYDIECQGDPACACLETVENCEQDCLDVGGEDGDNIGGDSSSSLFGDSGTMKYVWIVLSIVGAVLFIFIGLKILKWLFWMLALIMVVVAVLFWFVL